jgi:ABC-type multidrug transport system fused ATPase/permease subunit
MSDQETLEVMDREIQAYNTRIVGAKCLTSIFIVLMVLIEWRMALAVTFYVVSYETITSYMLQVAMLQAKKDYYYKQKTK